MKKAFIICLALILILSISGCKKTADTPEEMQIIPVELTEQEQKIVALMGTDKNSQIYDYTVSNDIKYVKIQFLTLNADGRWEENGGMSAPVKSRSGRIAISEAGKNGNLRMALQDEEGVSAYINESETYEKAEGLGRGMVMGKQALIVAGQEIALMIQYMTGADKFEVYQIENGSFDDTGKWKDFDVVNAVTITFSEKEF